jgi:hypothetical protein
MQKRLFLAYGRDPAVDIHLFTEDNSVEQEGYVSLMLRRIRTLYRQNPGVIPIGVAVDASQVYPVLLIVPGHLKQLLLVSRLE